MTPTRSFDQYLSERLADPEVRSGYEDYEARRAIVAELVSRRKSLGLSQVEVAKRMGVKQPTVSGFENEDADPRMSTVHRYARAVDACISMSIHTLSENGTWLPARVLKGWRPCGSKNAGQLSPNRYKGADVVDLAAYRRLDRQSAGLVAHGR